MTTISIIEAKKSATEKYLSLLQRYQKLPMEEILNDIDKKGALERYLYLATQATIDMAESIISYKNFRKPTSMSETFHILNEEGIISNELTEALIKMTGFRNIMAHDYEKIDYEIVERVLRVGLNDIQSFLDRTADYLRIN